MKHNVPVLAESTRLEYLRTMGVDVWYQKNAHIQVVTAPIEIEIPPETPAIPAINPTLIPSSLQSFLQWVLNHPLRNLGRDQTPYFTIGDSSAKLMVLCLESGEDELFAGKKGILLRSMLKSIGLSVNTILLGAIANDHKSEGELIDSKIKESEIDTLLLLIDEQKSLPLSQIQSLRESSAENNLPNLKLHVTYHPQVLLENPALKQQAWEDLKHLNKALNDHG